MFESLQNKFASCKYNSRIEILKQQYEKLDNDDRIFTRFADFPLSEQTINGLTDSKFIYPTDIQRESIALALQGKDVLGSAITGSGKTLAFLVPVLEHLYVNKWCSTDGVAVIILSPTRELAYQTYETLKKVGKYHDFSAGLIIGGKNLKFEKKRMDKCNILICTPGRLLQHMDENPLFNASNMEVLVLDEADRCMDMGFEKALNAIIANLQPERQTLLFSATQTKSVKDLARLSLKNAIYVGPKDDTASVPVLLQQNYIVVSLEDKLMILWSFIKNHLNQKCIVFLSSCKQVKYVYEIFCKLRPGVSLLALYGSLHQDRRIATYNEFVRKSNIVMFATDIASRGLDFPSVNWVVQLDCPEDVTQYIHRAGRSARNKERGESLLVLTPSEEIGMIDELNKKSIKIKKIQIDSKKLFSPRAKIEAFLAQNPELKATAKRAFSAYIKSVYNMKNKNIFNVLKLNYDAFAKSLGLAITPKMRFMDKRLNKTVVDYDVLEGTNINNFKSYHINSESDSDDLFTVKRIDYDMEEDICETKKTLMCAKKDKYLTKAAKAKKCMKKKILPNAVQKFDEQGLQIRDYRKEMRSEFSTKNIDDNQTIGGINIEHSKKLISEEDKFDRQRFREIMKIKHKKNKQKQKQSEINNEISKGDESDVSIDLSWLPNPDTLYSNERAPLQNGKNVDVGPFAKKRKVSPKLSLHDAETIATEILLNF